MGRRALAAAAAAAAVFAGCSGEKTVEDPRGTIEVSDGEDLVLELPVNPSVGFDWRLGRPVRRPLELDEVDTEIDDPDAAGSGGTKTYRFSAASEGRTELLLLHVFRGDVRERRRVTVVVR